MAFEIAAGRYVVMRAKKSASARAEQLVDLGERPDIEFAFLAFGIRIEGRGERALGVVISRASQADGFLRALAEERLAGADIGEREQFEKLRIVVEHLLEMRHQPALIDGIAREAAAEMIVDAAFAHVVRA